MMVLLRCADPLDVEQRVLKVGGLQYRTRHPLNRSIMGALLVVLSYRAIELIQVLAAWDLIYNRCTEVQVYLGDRVYGFRRVLPTYSLTLLNLPFVIVYVQIDGVLLKVVLPFILRFHLSELLIKAWPLVHLVVVIKDKCQLGPGPGNQSGLALLRQVFLFIL